MLLIYLDQMYLLNIYMVTALDLQIAGQDVTLALGLSKLCRSGSTIGWHPKNFSRRRKLNFFITSGVRYLHPLNKLQY